MKSNSRSNGYRLKPTGDRGYPRPKERYYQVKGLSADGVLETSACSGGRRGKA